ncbi:MAG TPA: type II toxin-antitoxin system Phd/YefM family antitoxin [Acidimicrobiales bacterium]|jgi:prevent-host-death family protein|nr:type II toxin-antitoxin system Phd/YefM family antitoxin [Acidimicrobiales bacterium]
MLQMSVTHARVYLSQLIDEMLESGEVAYVTRRGRPVAVLVDPEVYARLLETAEGARGSPAP